MKKWMMLLILTLVFVTACGQERESAHHQKKADNASEQKQETSNETTKRHTTDMTEKAKSNTHDDVAQLSEQMKAALVFSSQEASEFTLTKKEILTGIFEQDYMNKPEKKQLYKLYLIKASGYTNGPENMRFYSVYPSKKGFNSVIGISDHKAFVGGTQSPGTYQQLLETGKELDLNTLYAQHKQFKSLSELAQKIEFAQKNPMENETTRKDFEAKENPATMAHARSQVYEMIHKFEGEPINTQDYVWDNVHWNQDLTAWTVNYRNKDMEIVGTYQKVKDQPLIKLDANGNKVK